MIVDRVLLRTPPLENFRIIGARRALPRGTDETDVHQLAEPTTDDGAFSAADWEFFVRGGSRFKVMIMTPVTHGATTTTQAVTGPAEERQGSGASEPHHELRVGDFLEIQGSTREVVAGSGRTLVDLDGSGSLCLAQFVSDVSDIGAYTKERVLK